MQKRSKKYAALSISLFITLALVSCGPKNQQVESWETEKTEESSAGKEEQKPTETETQKEHQEEETESRETGEDNPLSLPNPIKPVEFNDAFQSLGITLTLPGDESWCSSPSASIIGGKTAQIAFYDERTKSDALLRAGNEKDGDPSGIYYNFDDSKKEIYTAAMSDGTQIDITIQATVDNSDVPGALAFWTYKGNCYSLWEDSARDQINQVGKLAVEIAEKIK